MHERTMFLVRASVVLTVIALTILTTPAWAAPSQDDDEIEIEGTIEEINLDEGYIVVDGTTVFLDEGTLILLGRGRGVPVSVEDLEIGQWVCVSGIEQPNGTVQATRVRVRPGPDEDPAFRRHPVAERLAALYNLDYDDVIALHQSGIGFGLIRKSYRLATDQPEAGLTGEELLEMRLSGLGWGQIRRETGVHPGQGRPSWAGQGQGNGGSGDASGANPGRGRGRGKNK